MAVAVAVSTATYAVVVVPHGELLRISIVWLRSRSVGRFEVSEYLAVKSGYLGYSDGAWRGRRGSSGDLLLLNALALVVVVRVLWAMGTRKVVVAGIVFSLARDVPEARTAFVQCDATRFGGRGGARVLDHAVSALLSHGSADCRAVGVRCAASLAMSSASKVTERNVWWKRRT